MLASKKCNPCLTTGLNFTTKITVESLHIAANCSHENFCSVHQKIESPKVPKSDNNIALSHFSKYSISVNSGPVSSNMFSIENFTVPDNVSVEFFFHFDNYIKIIIIPKFQTVRQYYWFHSLFKIMFHRQYRPDRIFYTCRGGIA